LYATVCNECEASLKAGCVPKASLVRVDTGKLPSHLEPLTYLENKLLAPQRGSRCLMICNTGRRRPADTCHKYLRGHVVAFPNPSTNELCDQFPLEMSKIPEVLQVVFLVAAPDRAAIEALARKTPALQVSDL
jgi:hypothetical protein